MSRRCRKRVATEDREREVLYAGVCAHKGRLLATKQKGETGVARDRLDERPILLRYWT